MIFYLLFCFNKRYKDRCDSEELKAHTQGPLLDQRGAERTPERTPQPGSLSSMFGEIMQEERPQPATAAVSELHRYLSEPVILQDVDPLAYWRANQDCFSALTTAARAYLSALCTSVDSEHLFSAASNILDD